MTMLGKNKIFKDIPEVDWSFDDIFSNALNAAEAAANAKHPEGVENFANALTAQLFASDSPALEWQKRIFKEEHPYAETKKAFEELAKMSRALGIPCVQLAQFDMPMNNPSKHTLLKLVTEFDSESSIRDKIATCYDSFEQNLAARLPESAQNKWYGWPLVGSNRLNAKAHNLSMRFFTGFLTSFVLIIFASDGLAVQEKEKALAKRFKWLEDHGYLSHKIEEQFTLHLQEQYRDEFRGPETMSATSSANTTTLSFPSTGADSATNLPESSQDKNTIL
jgi:hypothetical protein